MILSVVMAVRNGEAHLAEALDSIAAQSYGDFECLVVDDASTDETPAILARYAATDRRFRILRNERRLGPYPSANRALDEARGEFVARHDGDDISPPDRLRVQLEAMRSRPKVTLVTGAVEIFGRPDRHDGVSRHPAWQPALEWDLLFHNAIGAGAHVMFRRVEQGEAVRFRSDRAYAEDYALWCRLARMGEVGRPDAVVYRYRVHPASITARHRAEQDACADAIRLEYQNLYCNPPLLPPESRDLGRFWRREGTRPFGARFEIVASHFARLRDGFAAYVAQRYGEAAGQQILARADREFHARLGYWLYRSCRFLDAAGCRGVLAAARDAHATGATGAAALRLGGAMVRRRLGR
jgi:glycosyltransferase involved in cell wall biosynthesis